MKFLLLIFLITACSTENFVSRSPAGCTDHSCPLVRPDAGPDSGDSK